jgi:acetylglutamate kinase
VNDSHVGGRQEPRVAVVKIGGELLDDAHAKDLAILSRDARTLLDEGHEIVFVHGGGPQTTALQRALGQEPKIVAGRRITDAEALDVIKMVVGGKLNIDFCSVLRAAGINALGLNGVSGGAITATKRPPRVIAGGGPDPIDFGHVGDVTGVNHALLTLLLGHGYTPVLACIGGDEGGRAYNINADVVASGVAAGLSADRLLLITGTAGVLRDVNDPATRIATITAREARRAIEDGVVSGGMIPKLEESLDALRRGVREVHILGCLCDGDLCRAFEQPGIVGTTVVP